MSQKATGSFEVKLSPQTPEQSQAPNIGHMSLDKRFDGDLKASSKGWMLAIRCATAGSAGYVAMEQIEGELNGRKGTFSLQHSGIMNRGTQHLKITVVPDSGTDQLTGLEGTMNITITDGLHNYTFDYTLPEEE